MTPPSSGANRASAPVGKRNAAAVLVTDPGGRVLVVDPTYKDGWELPGGVVEPDESPGAGARREIAEELGLTIVPGRLLALDYVSVAADRTEGLIVVFDGGALADLSGVVLPPDELRDVRFVDLAELGDHLPALQARRARAAVDARTRGVAAYLEDGTPLDA